MIPFRNIKRALNKAISEPGYGWQAFKRRFLSYLTYKFFNGYCSYPETISLFLTYRCNLRCKMCGQWGEGGVSRGYTESILRQELSFDDIKRVVDDIKSFRPNITLFGGEPLLHRDWVKIVKYIKSANLRCNIITNGVLLSNNADYIVNIGVDEIIFSLDGSKEVHDSIRSAKGIFDKAYKGLKEINDFKIKMGKENPYINIASTIFEENYHELDKMVDIASSIGAKSITFHHLIFISREIYKDTEEFFNREFNSSIADWSGFIRDRLPDIDVELLINKIREVKNKKTNIDISFYPNFKEGEIREYYSKFNFKPSSYKCRCISPWMVSYILPDGSVREFHSINYSLGNIRENSFKEIWNGDRYKKFRGIVKRVKGFSVCSRCTEFYRY